jgi:phytol kinase
MPHQISTLLLLALSFLGLFGIAEFLYHRRKVKAEITRKIVHFGTGILTLLFPLLLQNHWQVLLLCGSFLIILLVSLQFQFLPSINRIDRVSHGSILYPVAVYGCYLAYSHANKGLFFFYLPILTLAICDPVAALVGKRYPYGRFRIGESKKTLAGSAAFFTSSCVITATCLYVRPTMHFSLETILPMVMLIATTSAAAEAVSAKGTDNVFIPAVVVLDLILIL